MEWDGREINDFEDVVIAARREVWKACLDGRIPYSGGGHDLPACGDPDCTECPVLPEAMGWLSGEDGRSLMWAAIAAGRAAVEAGVDDEQCATIVTSVLLEGAAHRMLDG